jgi:hypothetical protein
MERRCRFRCSRSVSATPDSTWVSGAWRPKRFRSRRDDVDRALFLALRILAPHFCSPLSGATLDEHEGDTIHDHQFVNVLSPSCPSEVA